MEDLVRVCAADPGERALVAEQRVQPPVVAGEDLAQPLGAEPERLGPDVGELRLGLLGCLEPDAGPLLRPGLREHELAAVLEAKPERRGLRALVAGCKMADAAGAHQVDPQLQLAVVGREEQPLPPPMGALEPPPFELPQRRVERLQRRDVRRPCLQDRGGRHERVELAQPRLHLG